MDQLEIFPIKGRHSCPEEWATNLPIDVHEPASAFADQVLEGSLNLSVGEGLTKRSGNSLSIRGSFQGLPSFPQQLFVQ